VIVGFAAAPNAALPCTSAYARQLCVNVVPIGVDVLVAIDAGGRGTVPLPIPSGSGFAGRSVYFQFLGFHPQRDCPCTLAPGIGLTASQGLEVRIQ
jgi:hypothetical protein